MCVCVCCWLQFGPLTPSWATDCVQNVSQTRAMIQNVSTWSRVQSLWKEEKKTSEDSTCGGRIESVLCLKLWRCCSSCSWLNILHEFGTLDNLEENYEKKSDEISSLLEGKPDSQSGFCKTTDKISLDWILLCFMLSVRFRKTWLKASNFLWTSCFGRQDHRWRWLCNIPWFSRHKNCYKRLQRRLNNSSSSWILLQVSRKLSSGGNRTAVSCLAAMLAVITGLALKIHNLGQNPKRSYYASFSPGRRGLSYIPMKKDAYSWVCPWARRTQNPELCGLQSDFWPVEKWPDTKN